MIFPAGSKEFGTPKRFGFLPRGNLALAKVGDLFAEAIYTAPAGAHSVGEINAETIYSNNQSAHSVGEIFVEVIYAS